jgi:hypothetical protein
MVSNGKLYLQRLPSELRGFVGLALRIGRGLCR